MIHPAPVKEPLRMPISAAAAVMMVLIPVFFTVGLASAESWNAKVGVLIFIDDSNYHWDDAEVEPNATALCATIVACGDLGLALNYSMSQYGAFVTEIGGLKAPTDFSWWWYLLLWNGANASWEEAPKGASDLVLSDGDLICWCPNSSAPPAPNPLTRYPWPCFRGNSQNTGVGGPGGISNIEVSIGSIGHPANCDTWMSDFVDKGLKLWEKDLQNGPIDSTPIIADGRVFVSTGGIYNWGSMKYDAPPHIFALNATDGKLLWTTETTAAGWQISTPAYLPGLVIAGTTDGQLLALNDKDGTVVWTFSTGTSPNGVTSSPLVVNGTIYIAAGDGLLYSLSVTGHQVWNASLGGPAYMCTPAFRGGLLVAGSDNGVLTCVNVANGTQKWNYTAEGKIRASPAIQDGRVFFISTEYEGFSAVQSDLHALSLDDGQLLWKLPMNASTSSPAVISGNVFVGTSNELLAVDFNGSPLWSWPVKAPIQSSPAWVNYHLYYSVNGANGTVFCNLPSNNGGSHEDWNYTPKPAQYMMSSPAIADGRLYFCSDNGKAYCFGPKPQPQLNATLQVPGKLVDGKTVKVGVLLVNNGTGPAENVTIQLYADGHRVASSNLISRIGPAENVTVILDWTPSAGSYDLGLGGFGVAYPVKVQAAKTSRFPAELLVVATVLILVTIPIVLLITRKPIRKEGRGNEEE